MGDRILGDLLGAAKTKGIDKYLEMEALAAQSPPGANKLFFNPSLGGGSTIHQNPNIRGAYIGLDLAHTKADLARAAMEGIAMDLRLALDGFRSLGIRPSEMLLAGGGSKNRLWHRIIADVYGLKVIKTNIDQNAASLGAAAAAAVGTGLWNNFSRIDRIHKVENIIKPIAVNNARYEKLLPIFRQAGETMAEIGDAVSQFGF